MFVTLVALHDLSKLTFLAQFQAGISSYVNSLNASIAFQSPLVLRYYAYRSLPVLKKSDVRVDKLATHLLVGSVLAYWLYNMTFHWEHLTGHYCSPLESVWPDEYLGIPPDDYGLAPVNPNPKRINSYTDSTMWHKRPEAYSPAMFRKWYNEDGPFKM